MALTTLGTLYKMTTRLRERTARLRERLEVLEQDKRKEQALMVTTQLIALQGMALLVRREEQRELDAIFPNADHLSTIEAWFAQLGRLTDQYEHVLTALENAEGGVDGSSGTTE